MRVYGDVEEPVVAAMRNALASLPPEDSEVRARLMLVLAGELYYSNLTAEIDALVDAGTAMARRLGYARLLVDVLQHAYIAGWRRETIRDRLAIAEEAAITATEAGLVRSALVSRLHAAAARCAIGDIDLSFGRPRRLIGDEFVQSVKLEDVSLGVDQLDPEGPVRQDHMAAIARIGSPADRLWA